MKKNKHGSMLISEKMIKHLSVQNQSKSEGLIGNNFKKEFLVKRKKFADQKRKMQVLSSSSDSMSDSVNNEQNDSSFKTDSSQRSID